MYFTVEAGLSRSVIITIPCSSSRPLPALKGIERFASNKLFIGPLKFNAELSNVFPEVTPRKSASVGTLAGMYFIIGFPIGFSVANILKIALPLPSVAAVATSVT